MLAPESIIKTIKPLCTEPDQTSRKLMCCLRRQ